MTVPTWEYVREVISENLDKADLAASAAERGLEELRASISTLPFTAINVDVGENVQLQWNSDGTVNAETPSPSWTATVTSPSDPTEPDYSSEAFPTIEIDGVTVPDGIDSPGIVTFTDPTDSAPTVGVRIFTSGEAPEEAVVQTLNLGTPSAPPDVAGSMNPLFSEENGNYSPDSSLSTTLGLFSSSLSQVGNIGLDHPWGTAWENSAYGLMRQRADSVRDQLYAIVSDPATQGLPSSYWDQLATEAAARIARKKVGALRRARNGGAASYWGLPTETTLALSQSADQDALEEVQAVEGEIVKRRTELVREAYFKAIDLLVEMEKSMIATSQEVKKRAVDIFNVVWNARLEMYKANLAQFKYEFDAVNIQVDAIKANNAAALDAWGKRLQAMEALLKADETTAQIFTAETSAWAAARDSYYKGVDAKVRLWSAKADGFAKFEALKLDKVKTDLEYYKSVANKVQSLAQAAASLLSARTGTYAPKLEAEKANIQLESTKNSVLIETAKLTQAAQVATVGYQVDLDKAKNTDLLEKARISQSAEQANARMEIEQAQYVTTQTNAVLQSLAASYVGIYQALLQVSDVNLSSGYSVSSSDSITASKNQEKVWG